MGNQLVVPGNFLGGTSPADDLTLTVSNILSPNVQVGDTLAIDVAGSMVNVSLAIGMTPQQITQAAAWVICCGVIPMAKLTLTIEPATSIANVSPT